MNIFFYLAFIIFYTAVFFFSYGGEKVNRELIFAISVIMILIAYILSSSLKIRFDITDVFLLAYFIWCISGITYTPTSQIESSLQYIVILAILVFYRFVFSGFKNISKFCFFLIFILSGVHVFFTILQVVAPGIVAQITRYMWGDLLADRVQIFYSRGFYSGVTGQPARNAFFSVIFIGCALAKLLMPSTPSEPNHKQKMVYSLLMVLGVFALFLTNKRAHFLFGAVAIAIIIIIDAIYKKRNLFKAIGIIIVLAIVLLLFLTFTESGSRLLERFLTDDGTLSGRTGIWEAMYASYESSPVIGNGLNYANEIFDAGGHNIYLHLLCDMG
jgi:O-antigen ligase